MSISRKLPEVIRRRLLRRYYQVTFSSEAGREVLDDLALFCGAGQDQFSTDHAKMAYAAGMRRVWLRIQSNLNMTEEEILSVSKKEPGDE
jgi:hypothetical protein